MAKTQSRYVCQQCGRISAGFMGRCPQCGEYNSMIEELVAPEPSKKRGSRHIRSDSTPARRLKDIGGEDEDRISVPIEEFSRVLGGGIVPGSIVLVGGDPGRFGGFIGDCTSEENFPHYWECQAENARNGFH